MQLMKVKETSEVSLLLTEDKEIQELNKIYRKVDAPTDVLAFSLIEEKEKSFYKDTMDNHEQLLGDIVISVQTAKRQAKDLDHSLKFEIAVLLIHGLLHLLGYDHINEEDAKKMQLKEAEILSHLIEEINETKI